MNGSAEHHRIQREHASRMSQPSPFNDVCHRGYAEPTCVEADKLAEKLRLTPAQFKQAASLQPEPQTTEQNVTQQVAGAWSRSMYSKTCLKFCMCSLLTWTHPRLFMCQAA